MNRHLLIGLPASLLALSLVAMGCSNDENEGDGLGDGNVAGRMGSGFGGGVGFGGATSFGGASSSGGASSAKGGATSSMACNGVPFSGSTVDPNGDECMYQFEQEAVSVPVDMYIMMDRSISMDNPVPDTDPPITRWDAIQDGMRQFVDAASKEDLRAGIGFFGASEFGGDDTVDCNPDNYAEPKVEIGAIADNGDALVEAFTEVSPGGLTPTLPALEGAVQHAQEWIESGKNEKRATVIVLVTDGYPTQCGDPPSITDVEAVAKDAYENSKIRTFVVGLAAGFNLDRLARAGGTPSATLLDEGEPTSSLVTALVNITTSKISCEYDLPTPTDDMTFDKDKVQVVFTPKSGGREEVPRVDSYASCDVNPDGGWYYDNPANPSTISLCPCSCSRVASAGRLDVTIGCAPTYGIR